MAGKLSPVDINRTSTSACHQLFHESGRQCQHVVCSSTAKRRIASHLWETWNSARSNVTSHHCKQVQFCQIPEAISWACVLGWMFHKTKINATVNTSSLALMHGGALSLHNAHFQHHFANIQQQSLSILHRSQLCFVFYPSPTWSGTCTRQNTSQMFYQLVTYCQQSQ